MAWTAIVLIVMVGMVGLSIDWGKVVWNAHQLQNAADAAALAGAQIVKFSTQTETIDRTYDFAFENWADQLRVTLRKTPQPASFVSENGLDIVLGRWLRQRDEFVPTLDHPNAVKAIARREDGLAGAPALPLLFGPIFGTDTVAATRDAIALSQGSTGAGLITLLEYPPDGIGLDLGGGPVVRVNGGDVQVNSQSLPNPRQAFRADGSFVMDCVELNVCGDIYPAEGDAFWDTVDYNINPRTETPLPDPLVQVPDMWTSSIQGTRPATIAPPPPDASYPAPVELETHDYGAGASVYGMAVQVDPATGDPVRVNGQYVNRGLGVSEGAPITGTTISTYGQVVDAYPAMPTLTLVPGFYPGGIIMTNGNRIRLLPGVYSFGGGNKNGDKSGMVINGGILDAQGVMLYITASYYGGKQYWGKFELNGGEISVSESYDPDDPDAEPYANFEGSEYKYIAIFQDRATPNTREYAAKITGNIVFRELKGTLYFPTIHMNFSGTGLEAGTQLIAGSVGTSGNTSLTINYDGRFQAAGFQACLVQ